MNRKNFLIHNYLFVLLAVFFTCTWRLNSSDAEPVDLLERLRALPGVVKVTEIKPNHFYKRAFEIDVLQPVDHQKPGGPTFTQRVYLSHMSEKKPMVFAPSGTRTYPRWVQEIAYLLHINNLSVTHRYWEGSKPEPADWRYLTVRQSAADHHRIVTLFKRIYKGVWLSSGLSKSGMTALFHRRFYPGDVRATIAKGAPMMREVNDRRFGAFLESVADAETRRKVKHFQRMALENRERLIPMVKQFFQQQKEDTFSVDPAEALEYHVIEHYFHYFQYYNRNQKPIPGPGASADDIFEHLNSIASLTVWSEKYWEWYAPSLYQQLTELGCPGYPEFVWGHLKDLLIHVKKPTMERYAPDIGRKYSFNPEVMKDILNWLQTKGNNIIYIYGSLDPWAATAVELTGKTNALKIVQQGGDHRLRIIHLDKKQLVYSTLEQWLGIKMEEKITKR